MDTTNLLTKFARIGARLKVADRPSRRFRATSGVISLDVQADRNGEFFEVVPPGGDRRRGRRPGRPARRPAPAPDGPGGGREDKFLCGHDERHWFVAAVPETAPVGHRPAGQGGAQARRGPGRPGPQGAPGRGPQPPQERRLPPPGRVVLPPGARLRRGREAGPPQRAAPPGQRRQAALGRVLLPDGRRDGPRLLPAPQRRHRVAVPAASSPATRRRRAGAGGRCGGTRASTSGAASGTPTTRRSSCTAGTGS